MLKFLGFLNFATSLSERIMYLICNGRVKGVLKRDKYNSTIKHFLDECLYMYNMNRDISKFLSLQK